MKNLFALLFAIGIVTTSYCQELPKSSPKASVSQRIGLTDIYVSYSRPSKKDREIFGGLVPNDIVWRAGANEATLFRTSADIVVGNEKLAKGTYSIFIVPTSANEWKMIFNSDTTLRGTGNLKDENNVITIPGGVNKTGSVTETLEYRFLNVTMSTADLALEWDVLRMTVSISADPTDQVKENIKLALKEAEKDEKWLVYRNAAAHARDTEMTDQGLEWIKQSIELKDSWYGEWIYAELLAQSNDMKTATKAGMQAINLGKAEYKEKSFPYESRIENAINEWNAQK
jgi:hypothetical protein